MTYDAQTTGRRISAFIARKADQHPDVFDEHDNEGELSPAEVHTLQIAYV